MNEIIKVSYENDNPMVSGRELHMFLEVETKYTDWFKRMTEYGFKEGTDFVTCFPNLGSGLNGGQNKQDHALTIPMAKELCMIQRSEKGKLARQYFIKAEEAWNSPEAIMDRALKISAARMKALFGEISTLKVENQIMQPKADYFDELVDRNLLTSFRDTAKQLDIKQSDLIKFLTEKKYIYRDKKGKLMPYADKINGLFEVKECFNEKTDWAGVQTMVTPKGRETFRLLVGN